MKKRVAIVYDRVNKWGGAERVLLALHKIFPRASLYTSVCDLKTAPWAKVFPQINTSFLQHVPFAKSNHEFFAPIMPLAFRLFDFSEYDIVISVTSEFAKNIVTYGKTLHICYCLTPTRYLWSGYGQYFKNKILRKLTSPIIIRLRRLDKKASMRPDLMVAISTEVKNRIKKYYNRDSKIIFPPVNLSINRFTAPQKKYYLLVSRLDYGYKKVDLAIKAFNKLGYPLIIIGTGREEKKLKKMSGKNIIFAGRVTDKKLTGYYKGAKALIMPQEEDFGIVAVEAQSVGVPVIAFKKGGARDTVIDRKTGILFPKQTVSFLMKSVALFEKKKFVVDNLRNNAKLFSEQVFRNRILELINNRLKY